MRDVMSEGLGRGVTGDRGGGEEEKGNVGGGS